MDLHTKVIRAVIDGEANADNKSEPNEDADQIDDAVAIVTKAGYASEHLRGDTCSINKLGKENSLEPVALEQTRSIREHLGPAPAEPSDSTHFIGWQKASCPIPGGIRKHGGEGSNAGQAPKV